MRISKHRHAICFFPPTTWSFSPNKIEKLRKMEPTAAYAQKECVLFITGIYPIRWIYGSSGPLTLNSILMHLIFGWPSQTRVSAVARAPHFNISTEKLFEKITSTQELITFPSIYIRFNVISVDDIYKIDFILIIYYCTAHIQFDKSKICHG